MPRFTGQNKKRINPRYFLNETMDTENFTRMDALQGSGEMESVFAQVDVASLAKIAAPYLEDNEKELAKQGLIDIIMGIPDAELEEIYQLVKASLAEESSLSINEKKILNIMIQEGIISEGVMGDIAAKSSNILKTVALTAAILGAGAAGPGGSAEAAPRNKAAVEQMIIKGKMTASQKKRLANHPQWLKMTLKNLNDHLNPQKRNWNMSRASRDLQLKVLGASDVEFPFGQETTLEELKTFLLTGKAPGKKAAPAAEKEKGGWGFADPLRKGLKYLDRDSPVGLGTGWFDKE